MYDFFVINLQVKFHTQTSSTDIINKQQQQLTEINNKY